MAEEFNNIEDYIESDYQLIPEELEEELKKLYKYQNERENLLLLQIFYLDLRA